MAVPGDGHENVRQAEQADGLRDDGNLHERQSGVLPEYGLKTVSSGRIWFGL
jgi:hypothetical protein